MLFLIIRIVNSSTTNFLKDRTYPGEICCFTNTTDEALLSFYIVTAEEQPTILKYLPAGVDTFNQ